MSGYGDIDPSNKKIALLISILALVLAFSETLGKGAQTAALSENIEASNLWTFFQAKTIRSTTLRTAAETLEVEMGQVSRPETKETMQKRIADWKSNIARYDSEPETQEGRKELVARAKIAEGRRDRSLAAYHNYELASAAIQIAIVLASAEIITGVALLIWIAGGLGLAGVVFCTLGFFAPTAVHLF
jgi:CCR4-NOT transcriptional regulation complex NOT5 subunit